jgi:hypothetical protein
MFQPFSRPELISMATKKRGETDWRICSNLPNLCKSPNTEQAYHGPDVVHDRFEQIRVRCGIATTIWSEPKPNSETATEA